MSKLTDLKKLFSSLKRDSKSVLFTKKKIDTQIFKRLKTSAYDKDKRFVNLFTVMEDNGLKEKPFTTIHIKRSFVEIANNIDRMTLYSFHGPFQLLHADAVNLEFFGESLQPTRDTVSCLLTCFPLTYISIR